MPNYYQEVIDYFNGKAENYDDVDNQLYWVLSDQYFKLILEREIPKFFSGKSLRVLDAGAGTGRWTIFLHELFSHKFDISGDLIDISDKMLAVARKKFYAKKIESKFSFVLGNIENMDNFEDGVYDLALSFYNVISFVENPARALSEIYKKLKKGGVHISIVANKYHAYYFSILTNRVSELKSIQQQSKIRFNESMPSIHCFTPQEAENIYVQAGFSKIQVIGGPNFIYPGMEETKVHGSTEVLQNKLSVGSVFNDILQLEIDNYQNSDIVGRSNSLMIIAQK
jgi:ubiquinone/menaquinone biosynthesis C-methylase UbiE